MGLIRNMRGVLLKCDFFPQRQMLCYRGEDYYSTVTGGVVSLLILGIILAFVTNQMIDVVNKNKINVEVELNNEVDHPQTVTVLSPTEGGFMFALFISGIDFTDTSQRVFDILMLEQQATPLDATVTSTEIQMVLCTLDHFRFNTQLENQFQQLGMSSWLCPPLGYQMKLKGQLTSQNSKRLEILIRRCNPNTFSNCIGDANVTALEDQLGSFRANIAVISPQVNSSTTEEQVIFHRQQLNRLEFSTSFAARGTQEISDYQVQTDQSLLFFSEITTISGSYASQPMRYDVQLGSGTNYARILFEQASTSIKYIRNYDRVDDFLSYVGGLISSAIAIIFVVSFYNEFCYYVSVGNKLFMGQGQEKIDSDRYNLIYFFGHCLVKFGRIFGCCKGGGKVASYVDVQEEVKKQLDVVLLMRKIYYLEKCVSLVLPEHQLELLHGHGKPTLGEVGEERKKYHLGYKLSKKMDTGHESTARKMGDIQIKEIEKSVKQGLTPPLTTYLQRKKYEDEMSRSSFSSVNSNSVRVLKDHARVLEREAAHGNMVSKRVKGQLDDQHFGELARQEVEMRQYNNQNYGQGQGNWSSPLIRKQIPLDMPHSIAEEPEFVYNSQRNKNRQRKQYMENQNLRYGRGYQYQSNNGGNNYQ